MTKEEMNNIVAELHPLFAAIIDELSNDVFFDLYRVLNALADKLEDAEGDTDTRKNTKALCRALLDEYRTRYDEVESQKMADEYGISKG